jgi:hypothetical protein
MRPPGDRRPETYENRDDAADAENEEKRILRTNVRAGVTVREFWEEWTSDRSGCDPPSQRTSTVANAPRSS